MRIVGGILSRPLCGWIGIWERSNEFGRLARFACWTAEAAVPTWTFHTL